MGYWIVFQISSTKAQQDVLELYKRGQLDAATAMKMMAELSAPTTPAQSVATAASRKRKAQEVEASQVSDDEGEHDTSKMDPILY